MKKLLLSFILFFSVLSSYAQPLIEWQKTYGGTGNEKAIGLIGTTDGGFITIGESFSNDGDVLGNHGNSDIWVVKLNSSGAIEWKKCYGGTQYEYGYTIIQTSDGGYTFCGRALSNDGDVTGNHGNYDCWVVKINSSGGIEWQKSLGGTNSEHAITIQQTNDGGYILGGHSDSYNGDVTGNHGNSDYWVVKINSSGAIEWQKSLGGTEQDNAISIQKTIDGGYIVAGFSFSSDGDVTGNHGNEDCWVVKLNSSGAIEWQKCYGGTGTDKVSSIIQTSDGGYILVGSSDSNDGDVTGNHGLWDCWVVKLNSSGAIEWQKCYGGTGNDSPWLIQGYGNTGFSFTATTDSNDGDVSSNHGQNDCWVVRLNFSGSILWKKCYGGTNYDTPYSIIRTSDGGYVFCGYSNSTDGDLTVNYGGVDCWLVKLETPLSNEVIGNDIKSIQIFPNPTTDFISILSDNSTKIKTVAIKNSLGQTILTTDKTIFDLSQLATGIYFCELSDTKGTITTRKVIKQ